MQYIIGLTGLIGSGKSSVASIFNELSITVIDTDAIAHEITVSGGAAMATIVKHFGPEFIAPDGGLERSKMRQLVFTSVEKRIDLEQILHPLIFSRVLQQIKESSGRYVIVMVPLLFRAVKYLSLIHRSVFVDCDEAILIKRVTNRSGLMAHEVKTILKAQMQRRLQLRLSDDVLTNNGTISQLYEQVVQLNIKYQKLFNTLAETR